jgi:hypothetical protein
MASLTAKWYTRSLDLYNSKIKFNFKNVKTPKDSLINYQQNCVFTFFKFNLISELYKSKLLLSRAPVSFAV